jgi:hypothetical protein
MKLLSAGMAICILLTLFMTGCGIVIINDKDKNNSKTEDISLPELTTVPEETTIPILTFMPESDKPVKTLDPEDKRVLAEQYLNELPDYDFGDLAVFITSMEITSLIPQNTDYFVYNTRIERTQAVEEKYSTKIVGVEEDYRSVYDKTYSAVYSGDFYSDIIGVPMGALGQFYKDGLLMNLNLLPFIDYSKPYYDTDAMKQMSVGGGTYGLIGDFNKNMDYYHVMYFNKTLIKDLGIANPYDLVYDDEWTVDKFREMTLATANIDGVSGHGGSVPLDDYINMFFSSTGEKFMDVGIGKAPTPKYNNTRVESIIAALRNMLYNDNTVFSEGIYAEEGARTAFYDGNILFYTDRINAMNWFVDMKNDWGVVPFPKLDKSQPYHTFVNEAMPVICVPAGMSNINNAGLALQALNAASYGFINDNYYAFLQRDVVRDTDVLNMLDYINGKDGKGKIAIDFVFMFGNVYTYMGDGTYKVIQSAVKNNYTLTSMYDRQYSTVMSHNKNAFPIG